MQIIVGRDRLEYPEDAGLPVVNLLETKILVNSTILDTKYRARFMCVDIKDHFLATPMKDFEYMQVKYYYILQDIRRRYNLDSKVTKDGFIYIKI